MLFNLGAFAEKAFGVRPNRLLIVGDKSCGKTSLAFRIAYDEAAAGGSPLIICNQTKLEQGLPVMVKKRSDSGRKYSPELLARISMKYVSSVGELKAVICGLHCFQPRPSAVLIEDLTELTDPLHAIPRDDPKLLDMCVTICAYLEDALIAFLRQSGGARSSVSSATQVGVMHPAARQPEITPNALCAQGSQNAECKLVITDSCLDRSYLRVMGRLVPTLILLQKPSSSSSSASSSSYSDITDSAQSSEVSVTLEKKSGTIWMAQQRTREQRIRCLHGGNGVQDGLKSHEENQQAQAEAEAEAQRCLSDILWTAYTCNDTRPLSHRHKAGVEDNNTSKPVLLGRMIAAAPVAGAGALTQQPVRLGSYPNGVTTSSYLLRPSQLEVIPALSL